MVSGPPPRSTGHLAPGTTRLTPWGVRRVVAGAPGLRAPRASRAFQDLSCGAGGSAGRVDEELAVGLPRLADLEGRGGVDQWEAAVDRDLQGPGGDLLQQGAQSGAIRPHPYPA